MRDALNTARTRRYTIGRILTGKATRTADDVAAVAAFVAASSLGAIVGASFGLFDSPTADDSCSITSGLVALTSPNNPWTAADEGKMIDVQGAGVAGATLRTSIASYVSAGSITLATAASATVAASATSASGLAIWGTSLNLSRTLPAHPNEAATSEASAATGVGSIFDATAFGALFNGTADDTAAINTAIAAAAAKGGTVSLPAGTARLSAPIVMASNVRLAGQGWGTILKPLDNSADAVNPAILFRNVSRAEVANLAIDGNASGLTQAVGHNGIRMSGTVDCLVDRVRISNCGKTVASPGGEHIQLNAFETADTSLTALDIAGVESLRNRIVNCSLEDTGAICQMGIRLITNWLYEVAETAFVIKIADSIVANNQLVGFQFNGIEIGGPATKFNEIRDNSLSGHLGFSGIEADKGASYNRFLGNSVRDTIGNVTDFTSAMRCQGGVSAGALARYARGNIFAGNVISGLGASFTNSLGMLFSRAYDNEFVDNIVDVTIAAGRSHGIEIGDRVSRAIIARNQVRGMPNTSHGISNSIYQANLGENMGGIEISDNVVDSLYMGIYLANTDAGVFTLDRNRIIGNRVTGGTSNTAINLSTGVSDSEMRDNFIVDPSGDALKTNGTKITIRGNYVTGQSGNVLIYLQTNSAGCAVMGNVSRLRTSGSDAFRNDSSDQPFFDTNWIDSTVIADGVGPKIFHDTAAPVANTWRRGDIVWNSTPASGAPPGWVCTTGGTPGTWKAMANLA